MPVARARYALGRCVGRGNCRSPASRFRHGHRCRLPRARHARRRAAAGWALAGLRMPASAGATNSAATRGRGARRRQRERDRMRAERDAIARADFARRACRARTRTTRLEQLRQTEDSSTAGRGAAQGHVRADVQRSARSATSAVPRARRPPVQAGRRAAHRDAGQGRGAAARDRAEARRRAGSARASRSSSCASTGEALRSRDRRAGQRAAQAAGPGSLGRAAAASDASSSPA